jgi:TonB family protein
VVLFLIESAGTSQDIIVVADNTMKTVLTMSFRRSLYLSCALHLMIFGSTIAIAHYSGGTITSLARVTQVSLVSSSLESNREAGIPPRPHPRRYQSPSQVTDLPNEQRHEVPEKMPADPGITSLTSEIANGNMDAIRDDNPGGPVTASTGIGNGIEPGFGLIAPEQWSLIVSAIERTKSYPRLARERGTEGVVRLRFRLNHEGSIEKIEILESSGSTILDSASIQAVYRAAPMPFVDGWIEVPIAYVLK